MCISSKIPFICLLLWYSGCVQSAWLSHGKTARHRLFHGWTIQRSTNPTLSGELLPQGIVDSQTVYRGGLIEKPQWNGAPAQGFREAKSIQSMYYALSNIAEADTEEEQENLGPAVSQEIDIMHDDVEALSENGALDRIDSLTEETIDQAKIDAAFFRADSTSVLETTDEALAEADHFIREEDITVVEKLEDLENGRTTAEESTETEIEFAANFVDFVENPLGQLEETVITEEIQEQSTVVTEEPIAVAEQNWGSATILTTEATGNEDAGMVDENRDDPPEIIKDETDSAITEENVLEIHERDEAVREKGAALQQDGDTWSQPEEPGQFTEEDLTSEGSHVVRSEILTKETELESSLEPIPSGDSPYEQMETDVDQEDPFLVEHRMSSSNLNSDNLDAMELTIHDVPGAKQQQVESSENNHVSATLSIEGSSIVESKELRPLRRIPLFQRMQLEASKESAFLRVVRRYAEADTRRREMIQQRRMTESINGLEDVDALNDLFGKLSSAGIISKVKMYGKRVTLEDGTTTMGKKRKLSIELEWEMD